MVKAKSAMRLEENVASALCYVLIWLTGIIFFFMEKENKTIRFHAMQSILTFIPLSILGWILGWIGAPSVGWGSYGYYGYSYNPGIPALLWLSWAIWAITGLLWLILVFKAYKGEKFKLPVIGDIAEKHA
ncbi:MAG: hypothetical protein KAJ69_04690, partial [Thermoplasmatales archaeon]|nr:hypothetical protein [Thermoplasmatales archaeon]